MQYSIMNQSALEGFQKGVFARLDNLFLATITGDPSETHCTFSAALCDAMPFATEEDAWKFARDVWGFEYANEVMMVVAIHEEALAKSRRNRETIQLHTYFTR